MVKTIVLILCVMTVYMLQEVWSSTTVCDCETQPGGCETGEWQKGTCRIGNKVYPRCCKTTGPDDHCECREKCKANEYQREECGDSGYVCCERGFDHYLV